TVAGERTQRLLERALLPGGELTPARGERGEQLGERRGLQVLAARRLVVGEVVDEVGAQLLRQLDERARAQSLQLDDGGEARLRDGGSEPRLARERRHPRDQLGERQLPQVLAVHP